MVQLVNNSESGDTRTSDEDSDFEREDHAEAPDTMLDLEPTNVPSDPRAAPKTSGLKFEPYHPRDLPAEEITDNMFKLLEESLKQSKNPSKGYIYALSIENCPGYIKIGRTGLSIASRRKAIERCVPYKLQVYNNNDFYRVQNYQRLEKLIHEELRNERQKFACRCGKKATDNDCSTKHGEWFAISEAKASEVINTWRKWMSTDPYTEGALRPTEQLKIDYYNRYAAKVQFQWTDFVEFPWWKLQWLWLYEELHKSRPQKPNCSRWDSLCKYWKSNLVFYLGTLIFSHALFIVLAMFPLAFIPIRYFAFVNSILLGGSALLYAA